jgi:hypothetical protein
VEKLNKLGKLAFLLRDEFRILGFKRERIRQQAHDEPHTRQDFLHDNNRGALH